MSCVRQHCYVMLCQSIALHLWEYIYNNRANLTQNKTACFVETIFHAKNFKAKEKACEYANYTEFINNQSNVSRGSQLPFFLIPYFYSTLDASTKEKTDFGIRLQSRV